VLIKFVRTTQLDNFKVIKLVEISPV
jgi:hypothetical protein